MVHEVSGQHLGRPLIRLLAGEVDLVFINSMTTSLIDLGWRVFMHALSAALSRNGLSWLKVIPGSDARLSLVLDCAGSLLSARANSAGTRRGRGSEHGARGLFHPGQRPPC